MKKTRTERILELARHKSEWSTVSSTTRANRLAKLEADRRAFGFTQGRRTTETRKQRNAALLASERRLGLTCDGCGASTTPTIGPDGRRTGGSSTFKLKDGVRRYCMPCGATTGRAKLFGARPNRKRSRR